MAREMAAYLILLVDANSLDEAARRATSRAGARGSGAADETPYRLLPWYIPTR